MNEHEKIHQMLSLMASGVLEPNEETQVRVHLRGCQSCTAQLEEWKLLTGGLRRLPTPQPRALVVERARAQAQMRLAEEGERRWNLGVMAGLIAFAWALTLMSWPAVRFVSGGLLAMLDPRFSHTWIVFAVFTAAAWVAGGAAAVILSLHRRERRLA
jgi:anti-sigma factor RsiW